MNIYQTRYFVSFIASYHYQLSSDHPLGEIATCRQQSIERMMDRVHQAVDMYSNPGSGSLQCKSATKEEACDSLVLGFLIRAFTLKGVYPIASSKVMHKSIRDIKCILDDIKFPSHIYCAESAPTRYCSYCSRNGYSRQVAANGHCSYCGRTSTESGFPGTSNHSPSCSPIADFMKDIQAIYDKVVGLNLETFMKIKKEGETGISIAAEGITLWEYVTYD